MYGNMGPGVAELSLQLITVAVNFYYDIDKQIVFNVLHSDWFLEAR